MKAIINGHCVVPNGLVYGKALLFDEKIVGWCDIYDNKVKECEEIIDANGKIVAPGLIDMHIHGYLGEDTSDCKPDGIKKMAEGVIKNGVTSFLPTTMTVAKAEILKAFDICRELKKQSLGGKDEWCGAEILGVHSEGPFINPKKARRRRRIFLRATRTSSVRTPILSRSSHLHPKCPAHSAK